MPLTNWFSKKKTYKDAEIIEPLTPIQHALLDEITAERLSHYTWKTRLREFLTFSNRKNLENWRPDNFFLQVSAVTAFAIGGTLAAMKTGKREGQIYIRANQMTVYENKIHASRKYHDYVLGRSLVSFTGSGLKHGFFMFTFFGVSYSISAARGRSSWWEWTLGGAIAGGLSRFALGPLGMLAGGATGGFMGLVMGPVVLATQRAYNITYEQNQQRWLRERVEKDLRHGLLERNYENLPAFDRRELDALRARGELPAPETLPLPDNQFPLVRRGLNRLKALVADVFGSARTTATATSSAPAAQHATDASDRNESH